VWNADESAVVYVAEEKASPTSSFWSRSPGAKNRGTESAYLEASQSPHTTTPIPLPLPSQTPQFCRWAGHGKQNAKAAAPFPPPPPFTPFPL
jgi:hypothetical protein